MSRNSVLTDEQTRLNARLEAHMVYICPECGKAFRTQAEWRLHLNTRHDYLKKTYSDFNFIQIDERFHECQLCFKWVENAHKTIALLQYHYFMHLNYRETYRCVHCRLAYTRRRALNTHLLDTHMDEIVLYETKMRRMKKQEEKKQALQGITKRQGSDRVRKRNDLLQKALMDIDLRGEEQETVDLPKPNTSELALDRCLNAYEDMVRKEEKQAPSPLEEQLEALCQELFEVKDEVEKHDTPINVDSKSQTRNAPKEDKEMVTIEIDALGEEEMDQLKKEMQTETRERSPPAKRRRVSGTLYEESESDELIKFVSYLCLKCGKEFASMDDWRTHVYEKHDFEHFIENNFEIIEPERRSMCLLCREVHHTTERDELQKHYFKHLPYRSYLKCSLCGRTKTSRSKITNHIRYNHQEELNRKNTQLLIKPEPKSSPKRSNVMQEEDYDKNKYTCDTCQKTFKVLWRFERHQMSCRKAGISNASADFLMNHLREGRLRMNAIWAEIMKENQKNESRV